MPSKSYLSAYSTRVTPQSEAIPGSSQVPNSAGGHAWQVDDWTRLQRFLILGSEGGTYYVGEQQLTRENADTVMRCLEQDGPRTVAMIVTISHAGRAPKNDPAIFALAMAAASGDVIPPCPARDAPGRGEWEAIYGRVLSTRAAALVALPQVCRTGTHLFMFAEFVEQFRGWGRGLRRGIANWYQRGDVVAPIADATDVPVDYLVHRTALDQLAYQAVKYRQRGGWTHRDLLRLAHPVPPTAEHDALYAWITHDTYVDTLPAAVRAYEAARHATKPKQLVDLIATYGDQLPREALPSEHIDRTVWEALLRTGMPMTALMRNLATMTRLGVLKPMSAATQLVVEQLGDADWVRRARVHPLQVLVAMKTYEQGYSERGSSQWEPVSQIVDALDGAFYTAFGNVEASSKRTLIAIDLSGSMAWGVVAGMPGITPRVAAGAMALVTAAVEPHHHIVGFTGEGPQAWRSPNGTPRDPANYSNVTPPGLCPLAISPRQRLTDVTRAIDAQRFGVTDCSLPMLYALERGIDVDTFVVLTDNETWSGTIHPSQALRLYRQQTGIDAKLVVVAMAAAGFSIADPSDRGMLDVVGFDAATPQAISAFAAG